MQAEREIGMEDVAALGRAFVERTPDADQDDRREAALLAYAQRKATIWGSARFAAEFRRREDLERRDRDAGRPLADRRALQEWRGNGGGVVASEVADQVVGSDLEAERLDLSRPVRHAHVPRPPAADPEPSRRRRSRRRSHADAEPADPASSISPQEAAGMSAAGRRLYGLN